MAQLLIESMESEWDPEQFHDTHREKVEALVEAKRQGHEIVIEAPPAPAKVIDLFEALSASVAAAAGNAKSKTATKSAKKVSASKKTAAKKSTAAKPSAASAAKKTSKAPARKAAAKTPARKAS